MKMLSLEDVENKVGMTFLPSIEGVRLDFLERTPKPLLFHLCSVAVQFGLLQVEGSGQSDMTLHQELILASVMSHTCSLLFV